MKIGGLADLANVVNSWATVNVAQAVGTMDGTVIVPMYDWNSFLAEHIGKCVGIESIHHLRFAGNNKGHVFIRHKSDSLEVDMKLVKDDWSPDPTGLSERVMPSGLSLTRQWYLLIRSVSFVLTSAKTPPVLSQLSQKSLLPQPLPSFQVLPLL